MSTAVPHRRMGELLVSSGAVLPEQVQAALGHQRRWGGRLGEILVGMGFAREDKISRALAVQLGVPEIDLASHTIPTHVLAKLPYELCLRHHLIPFALRRDERGTTFLHVAMADPSDLEALDDVRFHTGLHVEVAVATETEISQAIRLCYQETIEEASPFGESRKSHHSTGELLRFGEAPLQIDASAGAGSRDSAPLGLIPPMAGGEAFVVESQDGTIVTSPGVLPTPDVASPEAAAEAAGSRDAYADSEPAFRAVEALVRILTRKGVLEEGEYLQEILREPPARGKR